MLFVPICEIGGRKCSSRYDLFWFVRRNRGGTAFRGTCQVSDSGLQPFHPRDRWGGRTSGGNGRSSCLRPRVNRPGDSGLACKHHHHSLVVHAMDSRGGTRCKPGTRKLRPRARLRRCDELANTLQFGELKEMLRTAGILPVSGLPETTNPIPAAAASRGVAGNSAHARFRPSRSNTTG